MHEIALSWANFPSTSVWLGSTHRVDALMCTRLVGLHDAPNAKVLSDVHFLAISMHNDQGNARPPSFRVGAGPRQTAKSCHQFSQTGAVFLSQRGEFQSQSAAVRCGLDCGLR